MPGRDNRKTVVLVLIFFWLAFWLFRTRYAMLDDALIHLRYAANLHQLHIFSYDGLRPNFGASSLAYVGLLALLRGLTTSPLLAKAVSVVGYLALIFTVSAFALRSRASLPVQSLAYGMLLCLLSPMGIRWLTDGMETGLVILAVLLLAWLTDREANDASLSPARALTMIAAGFLLVMLRIESLLLIALCSTVIFSGKRAFDTQYGERPSFLAAAWKSLPLPAGALLAALLVRLYFGTLLPDTAIAKTGAPSLGIGIAGLKVIASSFILGLGTLLLWLLSAVLLWRALRIARNANPAGTAAWTSLMVNSYFPLVLALACLRGQRIEGVRHVLWAIEFPLAWNILQLARRDRLRPDLPILSKRLARNALYAVAIFLGLLLPLDWAIAQRVMGRRALTFLRMRDGGFEEFQDKVVVAGDIGFFGYFTGGQVCDLDGLVNGRAAAAATREQRYQSCGQKHPVALFLSRGQMENLGSYLNLNDWTACQSYDFVNVLSLDRHYLLVPVAEAQAECARFGGPLPMTR